MRSTLWIVVLVALSSLASCKVAPQINPSEAWERMARDNRRAWEQLREIQRQVDWENLGDRITEVPGVGKIIVRDWRLLGKPGSEYVRLFFTYENSTREHVEEARVWVNVRDADGEIRSSAWIDIYIPWFEFSPGNTWTGELRVATKGAHLQKGWRWEVGAATSRDRFDARDVNGVTVRTQPR